MVDDSGFHEGSQEVHERAPLVFHGGLIVHPDVESLKARALTKLQYILRILPTLLL